MPRRIWAMPDYVIREATPSDFDAILSLWASIDRHTGLADRPEYLRTFHDFSPDLFLVAESDGRIVGTVIGGWDGWRANIARLATDAAFRRGGVAMPLLQVVLQLLAPAGVAQLPQRLRLYLPDALAGHVELAAHLLQRPAAAVLQPEAQDQHLLLPGRQRAHHFLHLLLQELVGGRLRRGQRPHVLDE